MAQTTAKAQMIHLLATKCQSMSVESIGADHVCARVSQDVV